MNNNFLPYQLKKNAEQANTLATQMAQIASKKIYAKDHGVKLDGVTDDTAALNAFFALFGTGVELVVDNGVALVTGQLNIPGKWNPASNDGVRKITFDNASINYQGTAGKACVQLYNHQKSVIDGLCILKGSNDTYVNFVGFWYSKFINFEVPRIRFNYNMSDVTATLSTSDSYTSVFERGVSYHGSEFYGLGVTGGGSINSITFNDCKFWGNQVSPNAQYNLKFFGTGFQNFAFNYCDFSYATNSVSYIDVAQTAVMRLNFYSCYFDSNIPFVPNFDFKGAVVNIYNSQLSSSQLFFVKTKNKVSNLSHGNYGLEGDNVASATYNLAKNGDMGYAQTNQGWQYNGFNAPATVAPTLTMLTNANTINGNSLQIAFTQASQYVGFNGLNAPFDGVYTMAMRIRKTVGNGTLQLSWNGTTTNFDLSPYALNEEIIISSNAGGTIYTQGTALFGTITPTTIQTSLTVEIMEITIVHGGNIGLNMPIHPSASIIVLHPYGTPVTVAQNGTIQPAPGRNKIRINNTNTVTGAILNYGLFDGHEIWLVHEGPNTSTITFDVSGTSHIADGTSDVLTGGTARKYVYNSYNGLWYKSS
jgi:hypothetical protein